MKTIFKKSIATLLSLLVLLASTTISASTHYCGKHLVSFEINKTAKNCFDKYNFSTGHSQENSISQKSCCKDLSVLKKGSKDVLKEKANLDLDTKLTLEKQPVYYHYFYKFSFALLIDPYQAKTAFREKSLPPRKESRTILYQIFLI